MNPGNLPRDWISSAGHKPEIPHHRQANCSRLYPLLLRTKHGDLCPRLKLSQMPEYILQMLFLAVSRAAFSPTAFVLHRCCTLRWVFGKHHQYFLGAGSLGPVAKQTLPLGSWAGLWGPDVARSRCCKALGGCRRHSEPAMTWEVPVSWRAC